MERNKCPQQGKGLRQRHTQGGEQGLGQRQRAPRTVAEKWLEAEVADRDVTQLFIKWLASSTMEELAFFTGGWEDIRGAVYVYDHAGKSVSTPAEGEIPWPVRRNDLASAFNM